MSDQTPNLQLRAEYDRLFNDAKIRQEQIASEKAGIAASLSEAALAGNTGSISDLAVAYVDLEYQALEVAGDMVQLVLKQLREPGLLTPDKRKERMKVLSQALVGLVDTVTKAGVQSHKQATIIGRVATVMQEADDYLTTTNKGEDNAI